MGGWVLGFLETPPWSIAVTHYISTSQPQGDRKRVDASRVSHLLRTVEARAILTLGLIGKPLQKTFSGVYFAQPFCRDRVGGQEEKEKFSLSMGIMNRQGGLCMTFVGPSTLLLKKQHHQL